ncbi:hypothetical protein [Sulfuracidifex metallicus]|nr:hypothetical protein [Sulfuracidifex metallicus]WOE50458.1 hypothetical protein RQ359_001987 [Sulfuracidifex metallicus DSM 6482 = JCM 9184]
MGYWIKVIGRKLPLYDGSLVKLMNSHGLSSNICYSDLLSVMKAEACPSC